MELEKQSDVEQAYRSLFKHFNEDLYTLLNETDAFNEQLKANIDKNDNFIRGITDYINSIITKNRIDKADKVLIVDYENVSHITINIKDREAYRLKSTKGLNINDIDVIYYRIATYFILNYAYKNDYKHVFVVCKNQESENYFIEDYKAIKEKGEIILAKLKTIDGAIKLETIDGAITTFKCDDIQAWLKLGTKCTCFKINNNDKLFSNLIKLSGKPKVDFHGLKGSDDSIIVVLYSILKNLTNTHIMSDDTHMISDFEKYQKYIIPFKLIINNLEELSTTPIPELVINYFSHRIAINKSIKASYIESLITFKRLLPEYYYGKAERNTFKNWYKVNEDDKDKLEIVINSLEPVKDFRNHFEEIEYMDKDTNRAKLNRRGKPYLDLYGKIITLESHPHIPYVTMNQKGIYIPSLKYEPYIDDSKKILTIQVNDEIKPYCYNEKGNWKPILTKEHKPYNERDSIVTITTSQGNIPYCYNENGRWYATLIKEPYRNSDGEIDKIKKYVWQPYLKKYDVTKSNKFYNKYLKYKVKYTALKNKLNL